VNHASFVLFLSFLAYLFIYLFLILQQQFTVVIRRVPAATGAMSTWHGVTAPREAWLYCPHDRRSVWRHALQGLRFEPRVLSVHTFAFSGAFRESASMRISIVREKGKVVPVKLTVTWLIKWSRNSLLVRNRTSLDTILNQFRTVHTFTNYFPNIDFNIILWSTPRCPKRSPPLSDSLHGAEPTFKSW
jgi:hypothetical protein